MLFSPSLLIHKSRSTSKLPILPSFSSGLLKALSSTKVAHLGDKSHVGLVGLNERSCYGYDVVVRNCDGRTPSWRDHCLQEECIVRRLEIRYPVMVTGALASRILLRWEPSP